MTEQPLLPPPEDTPEYVADKPEPARRDPVPWLYGLGFIVLAAAICYLWLYPGTPNEPAATPSAVQALDQRLEVINQRLTQLEQRPTADVSRITARLDALDARIGDQAKLASELDAISGRLQSLSGRTQTGLDSTSQQIDTVGHRVAALEASTRNDAVITQRLDRIGKLQQASLALAAGRPIGDLPGAPEALTRYAHAPPPTEIQLRRRFAHDEQIALTTSQPDESSAPFADRVWNRAQGLITIRRGEDVVIGNPATVALNQARAALSLGDLAGAIDAVATLSGSPAQAMAGWLTDAKALANARSALITMAGQG